MHFGLSAFVQHGAADAIAELNAEAEQRLARNAARSAARSDGGRCALYEPGAFILFTVTFHVNPANNLTCPLIYLYNYFLPLHST